MSKLVPIETYLPSASKRWIDCHVPQEIRRLPEMLNAKAIDRYILDELPLRTYMVFNREADDIYCMTCGKHMRLSKYEKSRTHEIKHRAIKVFSHYQYIADDATTTGECPHCGRKAYFKDSRYSRTKITRTGNFIILRGSGRTLYAMNFNCEVSYAGDMPEVSRWLRTIWVFNHDVQRRYDLRNNYCAGDYMQASDTAMRVPEAGGLFNYNCEFVVFYEKNLDTVFRGTDLRYNRCAEMYHLDIPSPNTTANALWPHGSFTADIHGRYTLSVNDYFSYLKAAASLPATEHLEKNGFEAYVALKVAGASIGQAINWKATSLRAAFGLTLQEIDLIRSIKLHPQAVQLYKRFKRAGCPVSLRRINKWACLEFGTGIDAKKKLSKALIYISGVSGKKLSYGLTYLGKQGADPADYMDYVSECEKLGYDTSDPGVMLPDNFADAHFRAAEQVEKREKGAEIKKLTTTAKKILHITEPYISGEFLIRPALSLSEMSVEGKLQHHCVGVYGNKQARGDCVIMLIRKADNPSAPYYTLELSPKLEVRQLRGKYNCAPTDGVKAFVNKYIAHIKKYIKAEEQKKRQSSRKTPRTKSKGIAAVAQPIAAV
jgi:hypothetical protein